MDNITVDTYVKINI